MGRFCSEKSDWSVQRQRQALGRPTGFHEFIELNRVGIIPLFEEPTFSGGTSGREDDVLPDTNGIAGELQGVLFWNGETQPVGNPFGDRRLAIAIKRCGEIEELAAAQGAEAGIQMIEPAVNKFEGNDFSVKTLTQDREDADIRALSISTEPVF